MKSVIFSPSAAILAGAIFLIIPATAEVRMLTGDSNNAAHSNDSYLQDLSADGDLVLFNSGPPPSGSTPGIAAGGLYRRKISTVTLAFVGDSSVAGGVVHADMSDDGRYITWSNSTRHIYWRDTQTGTTRHLTAGADQDSGRPYMSADGRYVAYASFARNLVVDTSKLPSSTSRGSVLLYDSAVQTTVVASLNESGAALSSGLGASSSGYPVINEFHLSGNGRYLIFSSDATNLASRPAANTAGFLCIYRRDLQTGAVVLVNRNSSGTGADGNFTAPRLNADGTRAVFAGLYSGGLFGTGVKMTTAAPTSFGADIFAKDLSNETVWWVTRTTTGASQNGFALGPVIAISGNGNVVSFASDASNLVAEATDTGGGTSGSGDIFRVDLGAAGATTTTWVSRSPNGSGNVDYRVGPFLPGTGNYVAFCTSQLAAMFSTGNNASIFFQGVGVGTLPVVVLPTYLPFATWAAGLPAGEQDYGDNPSGDGIDNLEKYFLGANAAVTDLSKVPVRSSVPGTALGLPGDSNTYLTIQFRVRRDLPPGFLWQVNASQDLLNLSSAGGAVQVGAAVADGDYDIYLFRYPSPMNGKGFMNVSFTAP